MRIGFDERVRYPFEYVFACTNGSTDYTEFTYSGVVVLMADAMA